MFRYVSCMMWMVSSIPNETRNSVLSSCPSLSSSPAQICFLLNAIAQIRDTEWGAGKIFEDGGDGWRVEGFRTGPCPGNLSLFMSKSQASCIRLLENVSHVIWWDIERHYIHPGIRKHGKMISIQKQIYRFIHKISRGSRQQQVYPNPMSSLMWAVAQTLHSHSEFDSMISSISLDH